MRRSVFDEVGLFDAELISHEDSEWGLRATRAGKSLDYAPEAVVYHRARTSLGVAGAEMDPHGIRRGAGLAPARPVRAAPLDEEGELSAADRHVAKFPAGGPRESALAHHDGRHLQHPAPRGEPRQFPRLFQSRRGASQVDVGDMEMLHACPDSRPGAIMRSRPIGGPDLHSLGSYRSRRRRCRSNKPTRKHRHRQLERAALAAAVAAEPARAVFPRLRDRGRGQRLVGRVAGIPAPGAPGSADGAAERETRGSRPGRMPASARAAGNTSCSSTTTRGRNATGSANSCAPPRRTLPSACARR